MTHFVEICEHGKTHGQCRCPDRNKYVRYVTCTMPEKHAPIRTDDDDMIDHNNVENRFTYHPPTDERAVKHIMIREHGKALAHYLDENVPDCPEKETAIQRVEEAVMWANAGLARSPE